MPSLPFFWAWLCYRLLPAQCRGRGLGIVWCVVDLGSLHSIYTTCSSSRQTHLTVLPWGHVATLLQKTVICECLWVAGRSSAGISSLSTELAQRQSSSESRMVFLTIICQLHRGPLPGSLQPDCFSTSAL